MRLIIETQPDDESCGPTCLYSVYRYYGYEIPLQDVIQTIDRSPSGGTFCISIGKHALLHGFNATIYINSLVIFDPSWFTNGKVDNKLLIDKLEAQAKAKSHDTYIAKATPAIIEYLNLGGKICAYPLSIKLLQKFFSKDIPIIAGLSSTNLYWSTREVFIKNQSVYDDIRGTPCGHFVVICGYDQSKKHVIVADPYGKNPTFSENYYRVNINRLINAILLGVITFDGNLTVVEPKGYIH